MHYGYWIDFTDGSSGYCEGDEPGPASAMTKAQEVSGKVPVKAQTLPYPAKPVIWQKSDCPPFCYRPGQCAGTTYCRNRPSCSD